MSDGAADVHEGSSGEPTEVGDPEMGGAGPPEASPAAAVRRSPRARRLLVVGVVLVLLGGFLAVVGPRRVAAELAGADPAWLAAAAGATLLSLVIWSEAQRVLFLAAGAEVGPGRFLLGYAAGNFAKRTLPGGRLGAPAVMAYALCREADFPYERGLTSVTVGYIVGLPAAVVVPVAALPLVAASETQGAGPALLLAMVVTTVVVLGVGGLLMARPGPAVGLLHALAGAGRATLGRLSTRARAALAADRVDRAAASVGDTVRTMGQSRAALALAFVLIVVGWVSGALSLSAVLVALGHPAAPAIAVLAVPLSSLGNVVPLPAGLGGVDATLATVLIATLALDPVAAGVVVLAYRLSTDGVIVLVGGLVTAVRAATGRDPSV